ncbi:leucine-rich repeat and death domain-containing protein 1-like [Haliotis rufescens]|uniref:leucine-rich repeat and death domain-containing protein 1-like n=1 Tax=Haliotis rufescens TaxID=6454 RepID=UPI00201ECF8F|nr:leucine-rich repeat and death domain-containing protein 1-like [Haliotis rufescens]
MVSQKMPLDSKFAALLVLYVGCVSPFLLQPDDGCPASYPCRCRGDSIQCGQAQLKTIPTFTPSHKSWTLFLDYNSISVIPDNAFKNIKIKELIMDTMNLLKPVTISNNAFQGQEATLNKLSMVNCGLTSLPPAFRKLNALTDLALDGNAISQWDDTAMRTLGRGLTRFSARSFSGTSYAWPRQFAYMRRLEFLDLSYSPRFVPDLDKFVVLNDTLTKLILTSMGMTEVPDVLKHLPKLTEIDMGENKLTERSIKTDSFTSQSKLQFLTISYNQLNAMPDGLSNLKTVTYLDISGNPMTTMDTSKLPTGIVRLIANHGNLKTIPANLQRLTKLEELNMYTNHITAIGEKDISHLPNLKTVFLGQNYLTSPLSANALNGDTNLEQLSLEFNRRNNVTFSFSIIRSLPKLLYLTVEHPRCTCSADVPQWWSGLTKKPDLSGHCLNTSKRMKDLLTTCQP